MGIGTGELIVLVVIVLIVFSAARMGALGNALGKFVYSFKKASKGEDLVDVTPARKLGQEWPQKGSEDAKLVEGERKS